MAKSSSKSSAKEPRKAAARTSRKLSPNDQIEKRSEEALKKLQALGIDQGLQNDLEWCLGSFRFDGNPDGLYTMVDRAVTVLKAEQAKKTKGVTARLITSLEKALQNR